MAGGYVKCSSAMFPLADPDASKDESLPKTKKREMWSKEADFIITVLGTTVGYGNLWRFPYICQRNGGGAFLIPFVFFLVTCGLPLMYLEMAIGQFVGKSNVHIWSVCPLFKGVGIGQFVAGVIGSIYYQNILAWCIYYMGMSCQSILPWTSCQNEWNTPECGEYRILKTLSISGGVEQIGKIQWHLALSLLASTVVVFLCIIKGVKSAGKVVYVTAILPYFLLTILLVRTVLLPGAVDGILFYLTPDFKKLLESQVWLDAFLQVFYSIGTGYGIMICLSSYNKFNCNFKRNSIMLSLAGEGTSLFSGFVIFTVLGATAHSAGVDISKVASSGPGLMFVVYPAGLSKLPLPQLWSFLFFVMMLMVGLDTMFAWAESLLTPLIDQFPTQLRNRRMPLTLVVMLAYFVLALPFTTQGGIYYFQILDWYSLSVCLVFFAFIECVAFLWIYGSRRLCKDIQLMTGHKIPVFYRFMLAYFTPTLIAVMFILVMLKYKPPKYGSYVYPPHIEIVGWTIALVSTVPVPLMAVVQLWKSSGTFRERLSKCCQPDPDWKPFPRKYWEAYAEDFADENSKPFSFFDPLKS